MTQHGLHHTYTDAPEPHPNLFLGSLQLLFWLFFRPSAWRHHVARIEPTLRPDFCLVELQSAQWRHPAIRRLLVQGYVVLLALSGVLIALILVAGGVSGENVMEGVVAAMALGVTAGVALLDVAVGMAAGVALGRVASLTSRQTTYSMARQIGGVIIGILMGIVVLGVAAGVTAGALVSGMIILLYALGERITGSWAGIIAGILGHIGLWSLLRASQTSSPSV
jgi:hypothetical protein